MKKVLLGGILCLLFLTGCGDKKLSCNHIEEEIGMTMSDEINITFDKTGEEIKKVSVYGELEIDEKYSEYVSDIAESTKEEFRSVKDVGGKVKTSVKDNTIKIKLNYKTQKLTDDQKLQLEIEGLYFSGGYDKVKDKLEDEGYTCK